jgi:hypothetical protein
MNWLNLSFSTWWAFLVVVLLKKITRRYFQKSHLASTRGVEASGGA